MISKYTKIRPQRSQWQFLSIAFGSGTGKENTSSKI